MPTTIDGYTVYGLGSGAMENNDAIETVTFESGVQYIGLTALGYCDQLESVVLSDTINKVEANAFSYSPNLERILVDSQNTVYDSRNDCNGLIETATNTFIAGGSRSAIPEGIVRIESNAFHGCTSLTEITIPNTVKTIGWYAFTDTGLKSIYIPANTTEFEYLGFLGQFGMFKSSELEEINVDADNPLYASLDGVLFNKDKTQILYYPQGKKDAVYVLPNTVTAIMGGGETLLTPFDQPEYLQNIIFPQSVTYFASGVVVTDDVFTENNVSVTVLNSNCQFDGKSFNGVETVYGFANSTTEDSSKEWHYNFVALDAPSGQGIVPEQTDSVYTSGSDRPATIYCTYALDDLLGVTVDYVPVPAENYTLASGSTVLQLHPDFLNTLSPGEHVVSLNYKNATASAVLTIESEDEPSAPPEDTTVPDKPAGPSEPADPTEPAAPDGTTAPVQDTTATEKTEPSFAQSQQSGVQKSPATGAGSIYIALAVSGAAMAGILVLCRKKKAGAC
ncbi:MAG: leucine-rich repeat protein [Clostridiales bacterium]|nr:leucine-rich repeat protein [Clostridiales bacterium]